MSRTGSIWRRALVGLSVPGGAGRGGRAEHHCRHREGHSGAVLPGVTVEAASHVLIEKTRAVVSDGDGQIFDRRSQAGHLRGHLHADRLQHRSSATAIIVPSNVTVPINADLRVGALEETVTVSGQSPVVDVQNVSKVQVLTRELMDTIPSARNMQAIGALVPGIRLNIPDVGGAQQTEQTYMATHGNSALHNTILLDGMPAHTNLADGAVQNYIDNALIDESVYQTSAISARELRRRRAPEPDPERRRQPVPGSGFFGGSADGWGLQADNVDDLPEGTRPGERRSRIDYLNDFNFAMGGPVLKDKLWYFGSVRHQGTYIQVPNTFMNNGDPGIEDAWIDSYVLRGTWQATPRNKFAVTYQRNYKWKKHEIFPRRAGRAADFPRGDGRLPRALALLHRAGQVDVSDHQPPAARDRLLRRHPALLRRLPARHYGGARHARSGTRTRRASTRCAGGLHYRTRVGQIQVWNSPDQHSAVSSISYVTGTHNIKAGILYAWGNNPSISDMNGDLYQLYQGGTLVGNQYTVGQPRQVRVYNTPIARHPELTANIGIFAQDQWAFKKFTFNYGIRWEYLEESLPAAERVAGRFAPAARYDAINCDTIPGMTCWKSWAPRLGRGLRRVRQRPDGAQGELRQVHDARREQLRRTCSTRSRRSPTRAPGPTPTATTSRRTARSGRATTPNFGGSRIGRSIPTSRAEYNHQYSAGLQHELRPASAMNFNWYRRTLHNSQFTDNRSINGATRAPTPTGRRPPSSTR